MITQLQETASKYGEASIEGALSRLGVLAEEIDGLSSEERAMLFQVVTEMAENGRSDTIEELWKADYIRIPVTPEEFLKSDDFLGEYVRPDDPNLGIHEATCS